MVKQRRIDWYLIGIAVLAAFLNFGGVWNDDTVNPYYTAAVTSMTESWSNFFYGALDPSGFVTVDKPPVALWLQTISALIFGIHGWSVILPQALAGVGSVLLLYFLIKPTFGKWAARIAALVMATTPIAVAVSRTNNVDSILVFVLLLGTWTLFKAVKKGKIGFLLLAFALIGIGFNVKMLQAYMVVPAFLLFYFIVAKCNWKKKALHLVIALVMMLGVSVSWAVIVDNTSASERPYIGSSQTNSVLELAFGYNGMERLLGQETGTNASTNSQMTSPGSSSNNDNIAPDASTESAQNGQSMSGQPPQPPNGGMQGGGPNGNRGGGSKMMGGTGMFGTGTAGPLRLFQTALGDQISWLLPMALFGIVAIFIANWSRKRRFFQWNTAQKEMAFWMAWLIPVAGFFSIAGFFHHYYLIMLAPAIAALTGAGFMALLHLYRKNTGVPGYLLPSAIVVTTALQMFFIAQYSVLWMGVAGVTGLGLATVLFILKHRQPAWTSWIAVASLIALLLAPTYWALTPMIYGGNSALPEAGPQLKTSSGSGFANATINEKLLAYVEKNSNGTEFLFGTTDASTAAPYIIKTGKSVMALGGFNGTDPILTVDELKQMIKDGKIKYFYLPSNNKGSSSDVVKWVEENGTKVNNSEWSDQTTDVTTSATTSQNFPSRGGMQGGPGGGKSGGTLYKLNGED
ncbi:dolichyl-phosphate-mannose-protein mannosyltransferase family protein [Listeria grandensis FSL F6-0971]|uniref:Dolichyl-phosphate-mannose-protein mannosyltransferase family protein n=1 Tax=Listeria grandensis FSL F6-0971 TaxID=1265819 RepID=W7BU45_9LIST|nr:glycosyltransferase family 39 protein [Listeria grandensis]EUJ23838.1 dolichyl-phosphate-mannose-protein mannosyltransferase family protein [Listeria grandensis FSL F6-0971]